MFGFFKPQAGKQILGADIAGTVEAVGCQNFRSMRENRRALRPGGTYAIVGGSGPRALQLMILNFWYSRTRDHKTCCLVADGPNVGLADLKELVEAGKFVPVIDKVYQLSEVADALRYFGEGQHKGKIAITMSE